MSGTALVIPAWNEAEAIGAVLSEVPRASVAQVIVVVGGPDDPTAAVANKHQARTIVQTQRGYGAACWTGAQAALADGMDIIAFLDGDYADPPAALPRLLNPIAEHTADLVLGCRDLTRHPDALPWHARAGNQLVLELMHLTLRRKFTDLPSYKAITAHALRELQMREMTYGWTVEMLVKAARANLRIAEIRVDYRRRLGGRSKVAGSLGGSLGAARSLLTSALTYATWRPAPRWSIAGGQ